MRFQYNGTKLNILLIKIHFIEHFFNNVSGMSSKCNLI